MSTATNVLHSLRGQQLKALVRQRYCLDREDGDRVDFFFDLCGIKYDTRNLSDKSLEEIDTLSGKYLDRVR